MAITYQTVVKNIKITPSASNCSNVITHVRFNYEATDGVNKAVVPQVVELDVSTLDANTFVDVANVTSDLLQSWIVNTIDPDTVAGMKGMLGMQLRAAAQNKPVDPWVPFGPQPGANVGVAPVANT